MASLWMYTAFKDLIPIPILLTLTQIIERKEFFHTHSTRPVS
jgi:hypothetical protein